VAVRFCVNVSASAHVLLPTMNLPDIDLEPDGRRRPDQRDFPDRSAARGACRGFRAMPQSHMGFQGGNRRRIVLPLFMMLGLFGSNNGRNARGGGAPFGSDQHDRPSSGRWQKTMKWIRRS
jgi:hypothetical protein